MINSGFESDLISLINRYSLENGSNTPDFILGKYLIGCIELFNSATNDRSKWFGHNPFDYSSDIIQPNNEATK